MAVLEVNGFPYGPPGTMVGDVYSKDQNHQGPSLILNRNILFMLESASSTLESFPGEFSA